MPDENDIVYNTYGFDIAGWVRALYEFLTGTGGGAGFGGITDSISFWWGIYSIVAILFSLLCIVGFIYAKIRLAQLAEIASAALHEEELAWAHAYGGKIKKNSRWDDIQAHSTSDNPSDWRLGIIEADIMLEEALEKAGYVGASIGDKLKTANPASFRSVQDAWDAHKVRNQIAHIGSDFTLTKRLVGETVVKYERVLREFGAI